MIIPFLAIVAFVVVAHCVRKRIALENHEAEGRLKQVKAVFDSKYTQMNDSIISMGPGGSYDESSTNMSLVKNTHSAALSYLNEVRVD